MSGRRTGAEYRGSRNKSRGADRGRLFWQRYGEKTAGKLLSATSVKVGQGFRLALPTGAYYTWRGSVLEGTPIEPDELVEFDWQTARGNKDKQLEYAIESVSAGQSHRSG